MKNLRLGLLSVLVVLSVSTSSVFAATTPPPCLDKGKVLQIDNRQVLDWKVSTKNQFKARARVSGIIEEVYPNKNGHQHFSISIGNSPDDLLEVIYNEDFGLLPRLSVGMQVEACGDYITSTAQSGPYPPSPVGAIIHWVHMSPKPNKHESGYVLIDGNLYGGRNRALK
ncbi:DUF3465 domain-containing protein [bacterium]|jgi:hypothetical protein|nr:DUF3465 domain-containing protein [bacterium]